MQMALGNQPMAPEIYRYAFYLFGRLRLVNLSAMRMMKSTELEPHQLLGKRTQDPAQMETSRCIQVPLQHHPDDVHAVSIHYCDVMMVEDANDLVDVTVNYSLSELDAPGLAILDSGCTRTMHGSSWAKSFEEVLKTKGLIPQVKDKVQRFRGVGGETISNHVKVFPVGIGGAHGSLHSAEVEGTTPLLLSRPFMQELGTIINLSDNTVSFEGLGVVDLPLIRTFRGHMAVSLLDFGDDLLSGFDGFRIDGLQPAEPEGSPSHYSLPSDAASSTDGNHPPGDGLGLDSLVDAMQLLRPINDEQLAAEDSPKPPPSDAASSNAGYEPPGYELSLLDELEIIGPAPGWRLEDEECLVCEDEDLFESYVAEGDFTVRKTTNKKGKKLALMNDVLESEDLLRTRKLQGRSSVKINNKPPVGRTWIKQLFAGQMGLTTLATLYGMLVGVPLDSSITSWDATSPTGLTRVHRDMKHEDPYLTVITHPCGPWGNWSKFNIAKGGQSEITVLNLREESRPLLRLVNKVITDRVKGKRHVFVEQPYGSDSIEEPEMAETRALIEDGSLMALKVDGCQVGYCDRENGLPHHKPSYYLTTMLAAESVFSDCKCDCLQHQPLEGANKFGPRTAQAAEWPKKLDQMVLECAIQQAHIEQHVFEESLAATHDAFPTRPVPSPAQTSSPKRRRRQGRVSTLTEQYQAPPVYVRPDASGDLPDELPAPQQDAEGDQDFRARQAYDLDPILNKSEGERRTEWLQIDPEIRKIVRDLHVNFGHPTAVTLQRILRRQGAKIEAIKAAGLMACDSCGESIRRKRPRPVRLPNQYEFNRHLLLDTMYAKDSRGVTFGFINILDDATGFQVVACVGEVQGPPASRAVLRHFTTSWSSWAGLPHSIQVDRGKEFMAIFADHLRQFGVEQEVMPLEAPWKGGKCEKAGDLWKELWAKVVHESQISGLDDVLTATSIVTQTRNSFPRTSGYSPIQWVLGVPELRLPGSLLNDEESQRLEVLEAAENPASQMAKTLAIRESAKIAQIKMDTDARVRRALLRQSTPVRGPFPVGSYVYFYRAQQQPGTARQYKWFGPARVIGVELRNPRRLEDADVPTEGGAPHSYWIRYGPSVILTTGEQMRFASEDELLAAHTVPHYAVANLQLRGARSFIDIRPLGAPRPMQQQAQHEQGQQQPTSHTSNTTSSSSSPSLFQPPQRAQQQQAQQVLPPVPEDDEFDLEAAIDAADTETANVPMAPQIAPQLQPVEVQAPQLAHTGHLRQQTAEEPEPQPTRPATPRLAVTEPTRPTTPRPPFAAPGTPSLTTAMQQPDLLDGHGTGPVRALRPTAQARLRESGPYYVDEEPWEEVWPGISTAVQRRRRLELAGDLSESSEELEPEQESNLNYAFMTGKAAKSEININSLSPEDRKLFDASMLKEWTSWQKFQAVAELTEEEIQSLPQDTKVIGTRWVHTDKNSKPRLIARHMAKKTGKTKEQVDKEFPFEAKSRLVVQGCQEDEQNIRSDSPTCSLLAFNLVCCISVLMGWVAAAYDASTAYLQSHGIARLLVLRAPRPPPPGVQPGTLFRARGSIYGTKDAGRSWWIKLLHDAKECGWILSQIELALFYLYDESTSPPTLIGVMASHVDDLITCGFGEKYEDCMKELTKRLHLKKKDTEFRFCGKNLIQHADKSISLEQVDAIEGLEYQTLDKHRRKFPNLPLSEEEKSEFRALIGSMGWIARQTRPDVMVNVSIASQSIGHPCIKNVIDLNKAVKMLKDSADAQWCFKPSNLTLENCAVFVCADSSFANTEGLRSQCGYLVGLTLPAIKDGTETPVLILEATSTSIKRVCRSTLAAEANSFLAGVEAGIYVASLLREIMHPHVPLTTLETEYALKPVLAFTDAKSLQSTVAKDAGQPTDKRVKILVAQVRELMQEGCEIMWIDTSQMLADVLTKVGCERELLLEALSSGTWKLAPTEEALRKKEQIRAGRHQRKQLKKSQSTPEDG